MVLMGKSFGLLLMLALLCLGGPAQATITIETVRVGDPGNAADTKVMEDGTTGYGSVGYAYNIGKYEVTADQYTAFLNAVAADDTYGLYNVGMSDPSSIWGCKIERSGSPGSYTYSVAPDSTNRPVNYVSYWNACRFANWLHNGQPTGVQGPSTTEDGAYLIDGYTGMFGGSIVRRAGARWFIPTEDEWYKTAYYKGHGTNAGYYGYPTSSDIVPGRDVNDPFGNNANWRDYYHQTPVDNGKYYITVVGQFRNSPSPYGTFDQGGNVSEWTEGKIAFAAYADHRCRRGGSFAVDCEDHCQLHSDHRIPGIPAGYESSTDGFRVAGAYDGPKITSITPNSGMINTIGSLRVLGQNFFPGATVRLTRQGQSDIAAGVTYISPTEVDCTLDLTDAASGLWNVVAGDANGDSYVLAKGYTVLANASPTKRAANFANVGIDCVVTHLVSTSQFYVESDDRSCGIMVSRTAHGMSLGQRVTATGTARTSASGEKYIYATALTPSGTGTIEPIVLSNKAIGGGDWFYDSGSGAGQKGMTEYRRVTAGGSSTLQMLECPGMNNVGLLITTFGKVTCSASGYFYIDDGSGCRDNSAYVGVKVLGAVPVQQGEDPVGTHVKVTGVVSCFKGATPDTSLYRQVRAREVTVIR